MAIVTNSDGRRPNTGWSVDSIGCVDHAPGCVAGMSIDTAWYRNSWRMPHE